MHPGPVVKLIVEHHNKLPLNYVMRIYSINLLAACLPVPFLGAEDVVDPTDHTPEVVGSNPAELMAFSLQIFSVV